ncbi:hypothetical protein OIDMADRAFT_46013 [Oidiodendron maius Zn]|uniref:VOC domain-containing protein n=1 Tax=Oidiodendron maius (strain Zn) TaxID=913774 RepID=A0A0C3CW15_OIDMZ|nr:hypothetical protein OIDMADRAFT_46013 [Oidiodendron maius Zn]
MPKSFIGLHHLKLPCHSIKKTHEFYTTIFPFKPMPHADHFTPDHQLFAKLCIHEATKLIVELRYEPTQANLQKGWDPITYAVGTRKDLERWGEWFDANGVKHSRIFTGVSAWVMACEDPDGKIVRLYVSEEEHEWTDHVDKDERWLGN